MSPYRSYKKWATNQKKLAKKLKKLQTHAKLSKLILGNLKRIRYKRPMRNAATFANEVFGKGISLTGIVNDQENIGWKNFSLGRWSPLWQQAQALHYQRIGSKKSAKRWTFAIIHHLMMTRWDLWQFRNKMKHAPDGPEATATNNDLNGQI